MDPQRQQSNLSCSCSRSKAEIKFKDKPTINCQEHHHNKHEAVTNNQLSRTRLANNTEHDNCACDVGLIHLM